MTESLGIIGIGAFGEFMLKHVAPFFVTSVYDKYRDLAAITQAYNVNSVGFDKVCQCDVVIIAAPVSSIQEIAQEMKKYLKPGQLVMDVASVKSLPTAILRDTLPDQIDVVSLHPLFGPQSGNHGIEGLNVAVCNVRGSRVPGVTKFLIENLKLNVIQTTPEKHDREMAFVQGLTHMIAKVFVSMEISDIQQTTKTYDLLCQMVELVRYDSDELFRTIERDNPFMAETKARFFSAIQNLENQLSNPAAPKGRG
jgi:prephenate dehydrogenase